MERAHAEGPDEPAAVVAAQRGPVVGFDIGGVTPLNAAALQRAVGNAAVTRLIQGRSLQRQETQEQRQAAANRVWEIRGEARRLINRHNRLGIPAWLQENALAQELIPRLPRDAEIGISIIEQLVQGHQDSEVAVAICANATDDQLLRIARDPGGGRLLFRLVQSMQGFTTSQAEKAQLYRAMTAITRGRSAVPVTVEVITFRTGFAPLDWVGERIYGRGARGHTAVVVADLVYSFDEHGWFMEGTKTEYMGRNTHRDGIGQVLRVRSEDALVIQDRLNRSIGTGTYFFTGTVCSDATAASLERVLGQVNARHNPQRFADMLAASGHVESTNQYARARR